MKSYDGKQDARRTGRNRLQFETSPYLRQHADNPVDWFPWGDEAFRTAAAEDKPIFLSIGYSSCHWCHVMEKESFSDEAVAALLNASFVCIKVDREERPDIDQAYMTMAQVATGQGGWPLTVIMEPDRRPLFIATYVPRDALPGRAGLLQLLPYVSERWSSPAARAEMLQTAATLIEYTGRLLVPASGDGLAEDVASKAYAELAASYDSEHGGFGDAPKFPTPTRLSFLVRYWKDSGTTSALEMVTRTLDAMRHGGIYDHLGSGFHRYSVDRHWGVPHFEKMLYDQALLVEAYLDAYLVTGDPLYRSTVNDVLAYMQNRLGDPGGAFCCAEDADSASGEGAYYVWTPRQMKQALEPEEWEVIRLSLGILPSADAADAGDENRSYVLAWRNDAADVAEHTGVPISEVERLFIRSRAKLLAAREHREPVLLDDKVVADWNGLAIAAFARAGRALNEPAYVQAATRAADVVLTHMVDDAGVLRHTYKNGVASVPGFLEDYAAVARGLFELHQASQEVRFLTSALWLVDRMVALFQDETHGGFFQVGSHGEDMVVRVKPIYDGALPSGNSLAAHALVTAARLTERPELQAAARRLFASTSGMVTQSPGEYTSLLLAHRLHAGEFRVTVVAGEAGSEETLQLLRAAGTAYATDNYVVLMPPGAAGSEIAALLPVARDHPLFHGRSAAYVCTRSACSEPVTEPDRLRRLLQ